METDSFSYKILKNISYSSIGFLVPILFSIFITPIVVKKLGLVDYGVYVLVNTLTGFLALLDLGLTAAGTKYLAEYHARQQWEEISRLQAALATVYVVVGLAGLIIFLILGKFFLPLFHIAGLGEANIFVVFFLAGLVFFVSSANSVYTNVPPALQRFDIVTKVNLTQLIFLNIGMLVLVLLGFKLKAIMAINLLFLLLATLAYKIYAGRLLPQVKIRFGWNKAEMRKLYGYGVFAALTNITTSALNQLDRLIIPIFLGPAALTYYSLPGNVAQKTSTVVGSISNVFFPMASSLSAAGETEKLKTVYQRIMRTLCIAAAAITASIMLFGYKILQYWLGIDFANKGIEVLEILALTYFFMALSGTLYSFLLGLGKVKFLAFWSMVLAVLNLALILALVPKYGIVGAAWAFLAGAAPFVWVFYKTEKDFLQISGIGKFYFKLFAKILFTALIFSIIIKYLVLGLANSFTALIFVGPASVILYLLLYWVFGFFDREDLDLFKAFGKKVVDRFVL